MLKGKAKKASKDILVIISKFGDEPIKVNLPTGSTVGDALEQSEISLTGRERTYVEGEEAEDSDVLENGDILSIVTPKQAGTN